MSESVALRYTNAQSDFALGIDHVRTLEGQTLSSLADFHARRPDEPGLNMSRLQGVVAPRLAENLWREVLRGLQRRGEIILQGSFVQLPEHAAKLSADDERIAQKAMPVIAIARRGAWVRDVAQETGEPEQAVRLSLLRLARQGELHQVVKDLYYTRTQVMELARVVGELGATGGGVVKAAEFRDRTEVGRQRAIQILEYFDRVGLLRRSGNAHKLPPHFVSGATNWF
jgi:selenocysteine-specific elongation factor